MKKYRKLLYIFMILFLVSGCKTLEKKATEIKNSFGIQSSEENIKNKNSIEITVSCGENSNLEKYINEGWAIKQEYSEEKVCSWKTVAASKDCDLEKDKGCKIVVPDNVGEEKFYLLEK
mgnify:FL=1|tara:strand:- start:192 stop:548 length:357 start_codon:yes stop_codon:yes gene_type:complete